MGLVGGSGIWKVRVGGLIGLGNLKVRDMGMKKYQEMGTRVQLQEKRDDDRRLLEFLEKERSSLLTQK